MKNTLFFLLLLALGTACSKSDPRTYPPQLDLLMKVTMTNGDVIYADPGGNFPSLWYSPPTDVPNLTNMTTLAAANMDFNGEANTAAMVANGTAFYAAQYCATLEAYGFDDWYLPAAGELNEMYQKLGPNGSQQITTGAYWSSSEFDADYAWIQSFVDGYQSTGGKAYYYYYCRCVRR